MGMHCCVSMAKMVTRTRHNIALYVGCLVYVQLRLIPVIICVLLVIIA